MAVQAEQVDKHFMHHPLLTSAKYVAGQLEKHEFPDVLKNK
jgi:hypothetical protein